MTSNAWIAAMAIACGVCLSCNSPVSGASAIADGVTIRNDTVWKDDRGQEIMCQGGNLCKFGDTFYFYGWGDYPGDNRKDTITCYSSRDLASWKFERHVFTRDMTDLTLIVPDRLHVIYNATTKKYVMIGKHILPVGDPPIPGQPRVTGGVSFFTSETPTGTFAYLGHEMLPAGASPGTDCHRDLAAFQDGDGTAYVVSSHDQHKPNRNIMITRLTPDYLHVDRAVCEVPLTGGAFEAPYIIKLKSRYWLFVSGGGRPSPWNGSPTYVSTAEKLDGPWTPFRKLKCDPDSNDSFNAQNDFLFEVRGTAGSFVLWGGDRWSQRTKLGIGKNVWLPLQWDGNEPLLKWYPTWNVDAAAGTWTADPKATGTPPTAVPAVPDATSTAPLMPRIAGDWWTVAGNPDLGELTDPKQQPVDFSIWQAADGTWQLWSCIRNTKVGGRTRLFYRWEGKQLTDSDWKPMGIALHADPNCGEESVQSPHVIRDGGVYHMFYGDWNHICHATSQDGKTFTRVVGSDGKTGMFGEGAGEFTRDPMVLKIGGTYHCYYCANPEGGKGVGKGVVFCRTSPDLRIWSESKRVAYGGSAGTGWTSAECPFVIVHDGWYYLFRTQSYGQGAQSRVYRSKDPMDFGIDDDRFLVGTLPVAAPEIIEHDGQTYIASLLPSLKGIRIARLEWGTTKKEVP
jgi:hypothetical protein